MKKYECCRCGEKLTEEEIRSEGEMRYRNEQYYCDVCYEDMFGRT